MNSGSTNTRSHQSAARRLVISSLLINPFVRYNLLCFDGKSKPSCQ